MYDAWLQFRLGKIGTALVGAHDEMTPLFAEFMRKAGHVKEGEICSEANVSVLLSDKADASAYCTVAGMKLLDSPEPDELKTAVLDVVGCGAAPAVIMTGMSGNAENDSWYSFLDSVLPGVEKIRYKHLFGVNFSSSAIGFYAAACCIKKGLVPAVLAADGKDRNLSGGILVVNAVEGRHYSIILLEQICGKY